MQITVFSNDGRFPVQFELAGQTQIYRFRHSEQLRGLEDIRQLLDEGFTTAVLQQFGAMRIIQGEILQRIQTATPDTDDLPEII